MIDTFKQLASQVQDLWKRPWFKGLVTLLGVSSVSAVFKTWETVTTFIQAHAADPRAQAAIGVAYFVFVGLVIMGVASLLSLRETNRLQKDAFLAPARRIATQARNVPMVYKSVSIEIRITDTFDVIHTTTREIGAHTSPIVAFGAVARSGNQRASLREVNFVVVNANDPNDQIAWIPSEDNPNSKEFVIVPLRPILPAGLTPAPGAVADVRTYQMRSRWPNAAKKLKHRGLTDVNTFLAPSNAAGPIPLISLKVTIPNNGKYELRPSNAAAIVLPNANVFDHTFQFGPMLAGNQFTLEIERQD